MILCLDQQITGIIGNIKYKCEQKTENNLNHTKKYKCKSRTENEIFILELVWMHEFSCDYTAL